LFSHFTYQNNYGLVASVVQAMLINVSQKHIILE